jgi:hypothetical protein
MTDKETMKLALEALDIVKIHFTQNRHVNEAITAIKQALAAPAVQEPVAWADMGTCDVDNDAGLSWTPGHFHTTPLYTTLSAPQRTWVGLTDEELSQFDVDPIEAKLMIAKLKEKNT